MNTPAAPSPSTSLPILTFDEASLGPSLGYVFDARWLDPYESIVSMLWKFAWINGLAGHQVVTHVAKRPVDPYEGIAATVDDIDVQRVARSLGVTLRTVRAACRPGCPVLRFCSRCMARGYHGVVHQLRTEERCPVHRCALASTCRRCGASSAWRLDARLLDAPFDCAQCRRRYGGYGAAGFVHRKPLSRFARMALTCTFLGVGVTPISKLSRYWRGGDTNASRPRPRP